MGVIRGPISLANPTKPQLAPVSASGLADSGAVHLCIPEHLVLQPQLQQLSVNPANPNLPLSLAK